MPRRVLLALLMVAVFPKPAAPQQSVRTPAAQAPAAQFELARPGWTFFFPRDHGSHDEFSTEWWYYTGHLRTGKGRELGFELTFFRVGVVPPSVQGATAWDLRNVSLAHFAITDASRKEFRFYERTNRSSPFTANAERGRLHVFNEGWLATTRADGSWHIRADGGDDAIDLILRSQKPPAIHGENGVSVKALGEGYASHYYSMTRLGATGTATVGGERERVTGTAWMDHEFGSSVLRESQSGWDWFSIQLDSNVELMVYQIRKTDGGADVTSSGSLVFADGRVAHLKKDDFKITTLGSWKSPKSGATYPMGWRLEVPAHRIALQLRERMRDQELNTEGSTRVTYWEGSVGVSGSMNGKPVRGAGYVEMTGYDKAFRMRPSN